MEDILYCRELTYGGYVSENFVVLKYQWIIYESSPNGRRLMIGWPFKLYRKGLSSSSDLSFVVCVDGWGSSELNDYS